MKIRGLRKKIEKRIEPYKRQFILSRDLTLAHFGKADIALFHEFVPPPYGGAHQFLRALCKEWERRGLRVENNVISAGTPVCLFSTFNFDFDRLRRFRRDGCRMVHRVDGPVDVYRGRDEGVDQRIWTLNQELADATIFLSQYSMDKHKEMGRTFVSPCVIPNASDPAIFHPEGRTSFSRERKIRLIATSWSTNVKKGAPVYKWLEDHLDWERYEFTFVGRSPIQFEKIRMIDALPSAPLAELLRQHDIYITATQNDSLSNALLEAQSCGLPALYLRSGGSAEAVGTGGLGFDDQVELPTLLDRLVEEYEAFQAAISPPRLGVVADRYLNVLRPSSL